MALGFILAPIIDNEVYHTINIYSGKFSSLILRPIPLILIFTTIVSVAVKLYKKSKGKAQISES